MSEVSRFLHFSADRIAILAQGSMTEDRYLRKNSRDSTNRRRNFYSATRNSRFQDFPKEESPLQKSLTPLENECLDNSWDLES